MIRRRQRIVILGAAGRDFHNFNVAYRDDPDTEVVAFTAAQIPGIAGRRYPPALAGPRYPEGIAIVAEDELEALCRERSVDRVVFAYSDVPHEHVMHLASRALACGADFELLGPRRTQLVAGKPVIAVCAVRTGAGKSQTARWLSRHLRSRGLKVAVIRHPMPYGDLAAEAQQRFASRADLEAARCTLEEREEYEPHLALGNLVFAGVDTARVLAAAEAEADIILWDGGNNDFPFIRPDLLIVLVDPLRAGDESRFHPGEAVLRMADVVLVAKSDVATADAIAQVEAAARRLNPQAALIRAASPVRLDPPAKLAGKRVLVIEDAPTTTHGGMAHGAGLSAAVTAGAQVIDPRPYAAPGIADVYARYPQLGPVLPAMGYSEAERQALRATIAAAPVDAVVAATPIDLAALLSPDKPVIRARYEFAEAQTPGLAARIDAFLAGLGLTV